MTDTQTTEETTKPYAKYLKVAPVTELDHWEIIEGMGGVIWSTNHGLADGRIEDPEGKLSHEVFEMQQALEAFVKDMGEKYGVVLEKEQAVDGKVFYWDWYQAMKQKSYAKEYEGMICRSCPYSKGLKYMISTGGQVPCGYIHGYINHLPVPFDCAVTGWMHDVSEEDFLKQMEKEKGKRKVDLFVKKRDALKAKWQREQDKKKKAETEPKIVPGC